MSKKRFSSMDNKINEFESKKMTAIQALNEDNLFENDKGNIKELMRKKKRVEDTHTRNTFLVRNDLLKRLNEVSKSHRGFKTKFINFVIEQGLNDLEK